MSEEKQKQVPVEYSGSSGSSRTLAYILIGLGVIWLLGNLNIFAGIWRLWPLLLVVIGVLMITGRLEANPLETHRFSSPLDSTESARVSLNLSVGESHIKALAADNNRLIDAELVHRGEVEFAVSGDREKAITLKPVREAYLQWLNPMNWFGSQNKLLWNIGLHPEVPVDLQVQGGVGSSRINLTDVQVRRVDISTGVGTFDLLLPAMPEHYNVRAATGTGELRIDIADGAEIDMQLKGGIGEVRINTPHNAAVRIEASIGLGDINVSSRFLQVSKSDHMVGKTGVWQTENFESAERKIVIHHEGGIGELKVR